jgi:hypothetical protein
MKEKGLQVPADLSEQNDTKTVLEKAYQIGTVF